MAVVFKWVVGALAITGAYHTVSAATAVLASPSTVQGTTGTRLSYQIKIDDEKSRTPESWLIGGKTFAKTGSTTQSMPPGLALALNTGIIGGIPNQEGRSSVSITAYEKPDLHGGKLSFTLTFNIAAGASAPTITIQPAGGETIEGGTFNFAVVATGSAPLSFWRYRPVP